MTKLCENCKAAESTVEYYNYDLCSYCNSKIAQKEPQSAPIKSPDTIILDEEHTIINRIERTKKLFEMYGYYYKCPYCYFVSIDLEPICLKCKTGKKLSEMTLRKEMPLGWS